MKPPNITPPPSQTSVATPDVAQTNSAQPTQVSVQNVTTTTATSAPTMTTTAAATLKTNANTPPTNTLNIQQQNAAVSVQRDGTNMVPTNINTQPMITTQAIVVLKPTTISSHQEQQAPLALTTQPQGKIALQSTSTVQIHQQPTNSTITPTNTITIQPQANPQPMINQARSNLTSQTMITTQTNIGKTTNINSQEQQVPLALLTQPQSKSLTSSPTPQIQQPQQQQQIQVPVSISAANVKQEQTICCLLDHSVRCDRVTGNASFSARIQKIVASKKMNIALDPAARHTYICDHHKAVITVAKKSVPTARESKAAARNLAAAAAAAAANNVTPNSLPMNNYNELALNQNAIQHPVNLELMANQGRLVNNHSGMLISMPMRPGTQIAYGPYGAAAHPNQVGRLDHTMITPSNYDSTGGDSNPSGSGGIEVDLQQLQVNTLRRYKRHFRVQTRPGLNKMQLAESLKHHFRTLPIIEKEAITYFVYIVKSSRNKLDNNPKAD